MYAQSRSVRVEVMEALAPALACQEQTGRGLDAHSAEADLLAAALAAALIRALQVAALVAVVVPVQLEQIELTVESQSLACWRMVLARDQVARGCPMVVKSYGLLVQRPEL